MNKHNSSLTQFIEEYPLYSKFGTDQPIEAADLNNLAFNFFCKHEKEIQPFRLQAIAQNNNGKLQLPEGTANFTEMFTGVCQSCVTYTVNIVISGASQEEKPRYFIRKIGQYPAPEASMAKLPDEISFFLSDESRELYEKALKNLDWEFGMGALAYFRRLIQNEVEKIIEALSNQYSSQGNKIAEALSNYKQLRQRTRFVEEITPFLPKSLQDHGANSLSMLYDAASMGIDELTETECIKKSKDIDTLFRYLVRKIYLERNEAFGEKPPGKYFLRYK
ncbi:MAG: hypothetical protein ACHQFX_00745 [Chitinophagales bacterium]